MVGQVKCPCWTVLGQYELWAMRMDWKGQTEIQSKIPQGRQGEENSVDVMDKEKKTKVREYDICTGALVNMSWKLYFLFLLSSILKWTVNTTDTFDFHKN